ncbi:MFS transporter, partial [Vibrio cholerae]
IALVFSFIFGLLDEIRSIILHSVIQLKLTNTQLTNTYILNNMVYSFSFSISTLLISYIVDYSSVQFAFFIGGLAYFLV